MATAAHCTDRSADISCDVRSGRLSRRTLGTKRRSCRSLNLVRRRFSRVRGCRLAATLASAAATVAVAMWILFQVGGARVTAGVDDIGELVAALVAAIACALAASRRRYQRAPWALLAASSFAWAAGEAVWTYYDLVRGVSVPFPSMADAGYLSSVPLACAGLLLFNGSPRGGSRRFQGLLDGCIIATTLLFASWATVLGPLYRMHHGGVVKQVLGLAYPMSDVVMATLVFVVIMRTASGGHTSLWLVMAGVIAFGLADSAFAYMTEVNSYGQGAVLDAGWVAGYLLIGLGAMWAITDTESRSSPTADGAAAVSLMAPYLPVLLVLVLTAVELMRGRHIGAVSWILALALVLLVLGREVLHLWDRTAGSSGRLGTVETTAVPRW